MNTGLINYTFGILSILHTSLALADFNCHSETTQVTLHEPNPKITRTYQAEVISNHLKDNFEALPTLIEESDLFSKFQYKLWNNETQNVTLTIVKKVKFGRGGCGRAGCEGSGKKIITGKLSHGNSEAELFCEEILF